TRTRTSDASARSGASATCWWRRSISCWRRSGKPRWPARWSAMPSSARSSACGRSSIDRPPLPRTESRERRDLEGDMAQPGEAELERGLTTGRPFERSDLRNAALAGATLAGIKLAWSDLDGANLEGTDLSGADLSGASLREAFLAGAKL